MGKPPRQSGRKVSFTPEAARRITSAVLAVEAGNRDQPAIGLRTMGGGDELVRATFTGTWTKGTEKTLNDAILSSVEYTAKNYMVSLAPSASMIVHLAYASGEWVLVAFDYASLPGYSESAQQILAHNASGPLVWLNTTACA